MPLSQKQKNMMAKLMKLEGTVHHDRNVYLEGIRTGSPSADFIYGNTWCLPSGFTQALFGPPKGGKTLVGHSMIGQVHRDFEDGVALKIDTEFREEAQMTPEQMAIWGIDPERYICWSVNTPDMIFDRIEKDVAAMCQDGLPVKMIFIDSISGIQGIRGMNNESVTDQTIGDLAQTLQNGFKRILKVQRKYGISIVLTAQVRAEMDQNEARRNGALKMAAAWAVKHYAEYFTFVEPLTTKGARKDAEGNALEDTSLKDIEGNAERTGHKIRVTMKDSSLGPKGRQGVFTIDYKRGIVNVHEEIFELGKKRGVIEGAGAWVSFGEKRWNGGSAMMADIAKDPELAQAILTELRKREQEGRLKPLVEDDENADASLFEKLPTVANAEA